jgi:hypothetical protein
MKLTGQLVSNAVGAEKDPLEKRWWVKLLPRRIRKWLLKRFRDAPPSVRRGAGFLAASLTEDKWILGYVIYGLILVFFVALPSLLAYYSTPNHRSRVSFQLLSTSNAVCTVRES